MLTHRCVRLCCMCVYAGHGAYRMEREHDAWLSMQHPGALPQAVCPHPHTHPGQVRAVPHAFAHSRHSTWCATAVMLSAHALYTP